MKKIIILVHGKMPYRFLCETPIYNKFLQYERTYIEILSDLDKMTVTDKAVSWINIYRPNTDFQINFLFIIKKICYGIYIRVLKYMGVSFESLAYRFNNINKFTSHSYKVRMSSKRKSRERLAGNYLDSYLGWPFPNSYKLYIKMYNFLYEKNFCINPEIHYFLANSKPDVVVFFFAQNILFQPWFNVVRKLGIKTVLVIGSWDRLTTKGPVFPNCDKYIVHSKQMMKDIINFHNIEPERVVNIGWPQMDYFFQASCNKNRKLFLQRYAIDEKKKVILFAANSERFGQCEPLVVDHLREMILSNVYPYPVHLIIRPHPNDKKWKKRFSVKEKKYLMNEFLMPADFGNIHILAELLGNVDLLIATQGSISLDAIAMGVPVINLAFDCKDVLEAESIQRVYEMDHYKNVVESGAVKLVYNFDELDKAINDYLLNPKLDVNKREALKNQEVFPFDGRASERLVNEVMKLI